MLKQTSTVFVNSSDELIGKTTREAIADGLWYVLPSADNNIKVYTYSFALDERFSSASRALKFLMGVCSVCGSDVSDVMVFSARDKFGEAAQKWFENASGLSGEVNKTLASYGTGNIHYETDIEKTFPNVYEMLMILYPSETVYDYLRTMSGGYIANKMLLEQLGNGFIKKFGGQISQFNLPGNASKDVNLKRVKYLEPDSELAKTVRVMLVPVSENADKPLFIDYSEESQWGELIRDEIYNGNLIILKSRFIETILGIYIALNCGVVWNHREMRHYYVMLQIKYPSDTNLWNFISQYITKTNSFSDDDN